MKTFFQVEELSPNITETKQITESPVRYNDFNIVKLNNELPTRKDIKQTNLDFFKKLRNEKILSLYNIKNPNLNPNDFEFEKEKINYEFLMLLKSNGIIDKNCNLYRFEGKLYDLRK